MPDADNLFKVKDNMGASYLLQVQFIFFHYVVAQSLFVTIQTAVEFLTTLVKKPDNDDWGKLQ